MSTKAERYQHSALGTGRVVGSRRSGRELRFRADDTGLSYWVQSNTLEKIPSVPRSRPPPSSSGAAGSTGAAVPRGVAPPGVASKPPPHTPKPVTPSPASKAPAKTPAAPLEVRGSALRLSTRAALEALRLGVVPADGIQHFTVGLEKEQDLIKQALSSPGGSVRFFTAPYGSGKSHTLELASQLALSTGFGVAAAEMDRQEVTFRRPKRMYRALAQGLKLPNCTDEGLGALLARVGPRGGAHAFTDWIEQIADLDLEFLGPALVNYWRAAPESWARGEIMAYMSGDQMPALSLNIGSVLQEHRLGRFRAIRDSSTENGSMNAVQLINDLSRLLSFSGARGLLIVLDEGEHYRDLPSRMQFRADFFMESLLTGIEDGSIPRTHLMMAVTPTPDQDYPDWITGRPLSEIADPTRADVDSYVRRFGDLYVDAYPQSERPSEGEVVELSRSLWNSHADIGNMRMLTKSLVSAWDIVRMTPTSWSDLLADPR